MTHAVLLAHGAGSDMHAPVLQRVADALAAARIPSLRFNHRYRTLGRRAPDSKSVLAASTREAVEELARRSRLPDQRLILGGRSMGGRLCLEWAASQGAGACAGLVMLSYPLHAAGKADVRRDEGFGRLDMPVLFVSGTRDSLASKPDLARSARKIKGSVTFHWIESADHGYRVPKSSGRAVDDVHDEVARAVVDWVRSLAS
jgi:predicted alpha/beta-hydrolase family hydrolase